MHYFPILKAKQGEIQALSQLHLPTKRRVWPLLQVPPPSIGRRSKAVEPHTAQSIKLLAGRIKSLQAIRSFLDPVPGQLTPSLLADLLDAFASEPTPPSPVLDLVGSDAYLQDYRLRIGEPEFFCLRLPSDAVTDAGIARSIQRSLTTYRLAPEKGVLLLDMGDVSDPATNIHIYAAAAANMFRHTARLPFIEQVLAAGAFPKAFAPGTPSWAAVDYPRRELQLWNDVYAHGPVSYGDYATSNPNNDPMPGFPGAPKVRYTQGARFVMIKGVETGPPPTTMSEQYHRVSTILSAHAAYGGASMSWGDQHIANCCNPASSTNGSRTTWVGVNTNHHIEYVVLTQLPLPGGSPAPASSSAPASRP